MLTKNNWLTTNLPDRFTNPTVDFQLIFDLYPFKKMNFESAVEMTVKEIASKHSNFYLALSGGCDSEFVLRAFHKFNIPITPIIVGNGNDYDERKYAFDACKELGITPVEIYISDDEFIEYCREKIFKKFNGIGYHATQVMFAAEYAEKNNGVLITGGHLIGESGPYSVDAEWAILAEYACYTGYAYPNIVNINFYLYTVELMYSMFPDSPSGTWGQHRHKLLGLEYREKSRPWYSKNVQDRLREMYGKREDYTHVVERIWTKEEFDKIITPAMITES